MKTGGALALSVSWALVAACGGLKVGDRALLPPVAVPSADVPAADDAVGATVDDAVGATVGDAVGDSGESPSAARHVHAAPRVGGCFVAGRAPYNLAPVSTAPVDPWQAVDGERPRVLPHATTPGLERGEVACDAAHDHCLVDCNWLVASVEPPFDQNTALHQLPAVAGGFAEGREPAVIGYRSVPASKRTLTPGALALVMVAWPDSTWTAGTVEAVDWAGGRVRLRGHPSSYDLLGARVAVLSYRPGGKVEPVGTLDRAAATVRQGELILPGTATAATSDPWSQVDGQGQPRAVDDAVGFDRASRDCGPGRDHCLRPWVWMVDTGNGYGYPARFHDGGFHTATDDTTLARPRAAYRTLPATAASLPSGGTMFFREAIGDEGTAHLRWSAGEVARVDGGRAVVVLTDGREVPLAAVRVPVVVWFPGDRATAIE